MVVAVRACHGSDMRLSRPTFFFFEGPRPYRLPLRGLRLREAADALALLWLGSGPGIEVENPSSVCVKRGAPGDECCVLLEGNQTGTDPAWRGVARRGVARRGVEWRGVARRGAARRGAMWGRRHGAA